MIENPALSLKLDFLLRRSRVGRQLGDEELARAQLERAKTLAVSEHEIGQTSWLLGLDAFFVRDYKTASDFFADALLYHPDPPLELLYYLGWALYAGGNLEEARNVFLNLLDLNKGEFDSKEVKVILAWIETEKADFDSTLCLLKDVSDYPPTIWYRDEGLYIAGYAAYRLDSLSLAHHFFSQISDSSVRNLSLARLELGEGNFDKAADLYAQVPTQEGSYGNALALCLAGNNIKSERTALDYLNQYPGKERTAATFLLLAYLKREQGRNSDAVEYLERGLTLDSIPNPNLLYTLAMTQFECKKYRQTAEACEEFLASYPEHPAADILRLLKARSLFLLTETDSAKVILLQLLETTTDDIITSQAYYYLGEVEIRLEDYEQAASYFSKVEEGSLYAAAQKQRGIALTKIGKHRQAIVAFEEALARTTNDSEREELLFLIEEGRLAIGVYPDRITMIKRFLEQYPDATKGPALQLEIALEYFERNNNIAALHELNKLLSRYPDSDAAAQALEYKAQCQLRLGRTEEALASYREIPQRFPKSSVTARSQKQLAELLLSLGKESEALAVYKELISTSKTASDRASYTLSMAEIYYYQKNYQTASDLVSSAVNESSFSSVSQRGFLLGVNVELARGNLEEASRYSTRYRNRFGETADYLLAKGAIDKASGRIKDALAAYREAASRFPQKSTSRIDALINAADCAEVLGHVSEARKLLEDAALEVQLDRQRVEITRKLQRLASQ